jgi:hypothetical protein
MGKRTDGAILDEAAMVEDLLEFCQNHGTCASKG